MTHIWSQEIDEILNIGWSLEELGISNWGLDRKQALHAIEQLPTVNVGVLGGDIYVFDGRTAKPTYDNWFCEQQPEEHNCEFIKRSIEVARSYISNYKNNGNVIFVIVPSDLKPKD